MTVGRKILGIISNNDDISDALSAVRDNMAADCCMTVYDGIVYYIWEVTGPPKTATGCVSLSRVEPLTFTSERVDTAHLINISIGRQTVD